VDKDLGDRVSLGQEGRRRWGRVCQSGDVLAHIKTMTCLRDAVKFFR